VRRQGVAVPAQQQVERTDQQVFLPLPDRDPRIEIGGTVRTQRHQGALERDDQIVVSGPHVASRGVLDGPLPVRGDLPFQSGGQLRGQVAAELVDGQRDAVLAAADVLRRGHAAICDRSAKGCSRSAKALRTGVQMQPMSTPYGSQLVIRGILPVPAP
jgi:hypothetical protein